MTMIIEASGEEHRRSLNHQIALHFGWTCEADYHDNPDEWEGQRDPKGNSGFSNVPDFLCVLKYIMPALTSILQGSDE